MTLTNSLCILQPHPWLDREVNTTNDITRFAQTQTDIALLLQFIHPHQQARHIV